jgi:hypothetical protein
MTDQEKQAADIAAVKFNEAVWSSQDMSSALYCIGEAQKELTTGKGWGLIPLESTQTYLRMALDAIDRLRLLKENA